MANTLRFKRGLVAGIPNGALGEPLFTTDTFDLYIGNGTGNTRFQKYIASGATTQILRGDGSLYTFPLNISSPSNGQVLKYDGTNWVNSADAGVTGSGTAGQVTYWGSSSTITGSNNLFWDNANGRLGIGTNAPTTNLEVSGGFNVTDGTTTIRAVNSGGLGLFGTLTNHDLVLRTNNTERARIKATGNFIINNASTDNGLRFQVTGDASVNGNTASYIAQLNQANTTAGASFGVIIRGGTNVSDTALRVQNAAQTANLLTIQGNGSLGLGTTLLTGYNVRINKTITGSAVAYGIDIDSAIQSDVTNAAIIYGTSVGTQATSFTLGSLYHFNATQGTFGAGSAVTSQFGFRVSFNMIGATNNYAYYGEIPSGTGRWNLYMNGTAANFLAGNLGVGTNSISARLHVSSTSSGDGIRVSNTGTATIRLFNNSQTTGSFELGQGFASGTDNVAYVWNGSNAAMVFGTNATERMRLDASGNLGLGVTPSTWSLTDLSAMQIRNGGFYGYSVNEVGVTSNSYFNAGWKYINSSFATQYSTFNGAHRWYNAPSGTAGNPISFVQAMTLDASGRLGIGTTSPDSRLHVVDGFGNSIRVGFQGGTNNFNLYDANIHAFRNNNGTTEYVRIFSDGNVLLNSTGVNAGYKLDVNGTMRVSGASTLSGFVTINNSVSTSLNQNATTYVAVTNTDIGVNTKAEFQAFSRNGGTTRFGRNSNLTTAYKILNASDAYVLNETLGDFAILNDNASGSIKMAAGGSSTAHFTIASTGAATFSSSVTVNGNMTNAFASLAGGTTVIGGITGVSNGFRIDVDTSNQYQYSFRSGTNTTLFQIANTGAATFSSSVTSASLNVNSGGAYISGFRGGLSSPNAGQLYYGADNTGWQFSIGKLVSSTYTAQMVFKDNSTITTTSDFIIAGGYGLDFINGSGNTVTAIRSTAGGTSIMSSTSTGTHIAVGTEAASDLILASNNTERIRLSSNGFFSQINATNPSSSITDSYIQYSADVTAGNAAPHFRTENGAVIKLYQETTAVGNAIVGAGGGSAMLDDDTFDGYTLRQVVRALRNQGILQ